MFELFRIYISISRMEQFKDDNGKVYNFINIQSTIHIHIMFPIQVCKKFFAMSIHFFHIEKIFFVYLIFISITRKVIFFNYYQ